MLTLATREGDNLDPSQEACLIAGREVQVQSSGSKVQMQSSGSSLEPSPMQTQKRWRRLETLRLAEQVPKTQIAGGNSMRHQMAPPETYQRG